MPSNSVGIVPALTNSTGAASRLAPIILSAALEFQRAGDDAAQFADAFPFLDQRLHRSSRRRVGEDLQMHAFVLAGKRDSQASSMVKHRMGANQVTMRRKISSITVRAARRRALSAASQ